MNTLFDGIPEFVAVARLGSFTRAAGELGVTKSAAARAVSRLEVRLGAKLLHRTTRRLTLTADGEIWLAHCVAVLAELDRGAESLTMARSEPSGRLRIDLPSAFGRLYMMPLLIDLAKQYPALMLSVSFTDRRVDLIAEGIDLAVRIGVLDDSPDLVARPLGVQQLVICGTPAYLEEHGSPGSAEDLAKHDCITGWRSELHAAWLLKQPDGTTAPHIIKVKHEFLDYEAMLTAVRSGLGLAQLPLWLVGDDLRRGTVATVLEGMSGGQLPINILWPRTQTLSARMRITINEIARAANAFAGSTPQVKMDRL
ncbi:LysR family transcriptional regulator [Candidatus Phyllobacterium onerii]|uniref:LysR family transcriptional regulator n=1 Tax=Candidatus Phyllobacterium onerii TaxID=3020828 RepID=UPI00232DEE4F|nr:LysR family transcriptional regulator [Phyllobacterium sp. IY22]